MKNNLIFKAMEFGDDSRSIIIMPDHFEIHIEITDNADYENHKEPTSLEVIITFSRMENHDDEESVLTKVHLFPCVDVPVDLFGEFVIEEAGINVENGMLERICEDISEYLTSMDEDETSFDLEEYSNCWGCYLDKFIIAKTKRASFENETCIFHTFFSRSSKQRLITFQMAIKRCSIIV